MSNDMLVFEATAVVVANEEKAVLSKRFPPKMRGRDPDSIVIIPPSRRR